MVYPGRDRGSWGPLRRGEGQDTRQFGRAGPSAGYSFWPLALESAEGVLVEEMAPPGVEVIVGGVLDEQFGPVVMFGSGGVLVELFKDVAFALAPATREDAHWLIRQVRGYRLLKGYRGSPAVDIDSLLEVIVKVSEAISSGLLKEMDLNPVSLYPEGAMALDAKMLMAAGQAPL